MAAKLHTLVGIPQVAVGIAAVTVQLLDLPGHAERGAADNTVCSVQPFQQLREHAEPAGVDTAGAAGAAVELEAEVVGSAVATDQDLRGCTLVQEVADMS